MLCSLRFNETVASGSIKIESTPSIYHWQFVNALTEVQNDKVYIRADKRARYGAVIEVLDRVRSAGIENIAFLVDEQKSLSPP